MTTIIDQKFLMDVWNGESDDVLLRQIEAGADVNAQDPEDGMTSIHHAVGRFSPSMLALLLSTGKADLQIQDYKGRTPLDLAFEDAAFGNRETEEIIDMLTSYQNHRPSIEP